MFVHGCWIRGLEQVCISEPAVATAAADAATVIAAIATTTDVPSVTTDEWLVCFPHEPAVGPKNTRAPEHGRAGLVAHSRPDKPRMGHTTGIL